MPKSAHVCAVCGGEFFAYASAHRRYCSPACCHKATGAAWRAGTRDRPTKPRRGTTQLCAVCGKDFYRPPAEDTRFCSPECTNRWQRRNRITRICPTCGKEFERSPSVGAHQTHCSKRCAGDNVKRPAGWMHNGRPARLDADGYVLVWEPDHPNKSQHGWQYEHRLVAERMLGRYLSSDEDVHHKREPKSNNDPSNLEVMQGLAHAALSARNYRDLVQESLAELAAYRARYGPLVKE